MTYAAIGIFLLLILIGLSMVACLIWLVTSALARAYPAYSFRLGYPMVLGLLGFVLGFTNLELPTVPPPLKGLGVLCFGLLVGLYAGRKPKGNN
jgi:hypothetical protein